jgi:hypothetical protein
LQVFWNVTIKYRFFVAAPIKPSFGIFIVKSSGIRGPKSYVILTENFPCLGPKNLIHKFQPNQTFGLQRDSICYFWSRCICRVFPFEAYFVFSVRIGRIPFSSLVDLRGNGRFGKIVKFLNKIIFFWGKFVENSRKYKINEKRNYKKFKRKFYKIIKSRKF